MAAGWFCIDLVQPPPIKSAVTEPISASPSYTNADKVAAKVREHGVESLSAEEIKVILRQVAFADAKCFFVALHVT